VAGVFVSDYDYKVPMLVDSIANEFTERFAAWPIRFYVIVDGVLRHKAQPDAPNSASYDLAIGAVRACLDDVLSAPPAST